MRSPRLVVLTALGVVLVTGAAVPAAFALAAGTTAPASTTLRYVAGGTAVTDSAGNVWASDSAVAVGGTLSSVSHGIAGTTSPALFQTTRFGMSGYRIPVPAPGSYLVQIDESENYWTAAGHRVFSITAEGAPQVSAYDILTHVAPFTADTISFTVPVTDGALNLGFSASVDNAKVDSISVSPVAPVTVAPTAADSTTPTLTTLAPTTSAPPVSSTVPTPTPTAPPVTSSPSAAPVSGLTPMSFGAVGDGVHDDTAALQQALDAASATNPLVLPAGRVFAHSGVLHVRVVGEVVTGTGELLATNEQDSSVWVEADRVTLDGPTLATASTTQRWSAWEQMGLRLEAYSGDVVRNVTVTGSAAAGIYVGGAQHFILDHDTVRNTRADGIHMTDGAAYGTVLSPTTVATGDDGIAVVSYSQDGAPCHDITVTGAHVEGTTGGRGISVVGGTDIVESDFEVDASAAAGVYVAAEGSPYYTAAPVNVSVTDGTIVGANTDPTIDHGSILVLSGESNVAPDGVVISGMTITNSRPSASRDVGVISYGAAPVDVLISDITITGGPASAYQGNAPAGSFHTVGWTQNGTALADQ
jgi:hypothetical protein